MTRPGQAPGSPHAEASHWGAGGAPKATHGMPGGGRCLESSMSQRKTLGMGCKQGRGMQVWGWRRQSLPTQWCSRRSVCAQAEYILTGRDGAPRQADRLLLLRLELEAKLNAQQCRRAGSPQYAQPASSLPPIDAAAGGCPPPPPPFRPRRLPARPPLLATRRTSGAQPTLLVHSCRCRSSQRHPPAGGRAPTAALPVPAQHDTHAGPGGDTQARLCMALTTATRKPSPGDPPGFWQLPATRAWGCTQLPAAAPCPHRVQLQQRMLATSVCLHSGCLHSGSLHSVAA